MIRHPRRTALIAGLTAILTLGGGGSAAAYWTAQAQLQGSVGVATTGLVQTAPTTTLAVTYSSTTLKAAAPITVKNTGSRAASYAVTLRSVSATNAGLPGAITVAVAPVADAAACTTTTSLTSPQTGTLAATFTATGNVAAGASVVLCVQTSMTSAGVTTYSNASTVLGLRSSLEYAAADAWRVTGAEVTFTQTVATAAFVPGGESMNATCGGDLPWYLEMNFARKTGYEGVTTYRVYFARESTPNVRVQYVLNSSEEAPKGWYPYVQLSWNDARIASYLSNASGGAGNTWVFVEQSVSGGAWTAAAYGKIRLTLENGQPRLACGWQ